MRGVRAWCGRNAVPGMRIGRCGRQSGMGAVAAMPHVGHGHQRPRVHRRAYRNVQESRAPDGSAVHQQVLDLHYVGMTRGPLVYATDLVDGFKTEETIRLPDGPQDDWLQVLPVADDGEGPGITLQLGYRPPLLFWPYYRTGGRVDGAWRLTWLSLPPA